MTPEQVNLLNSLPVSNIYESLDNIEGPCPGTTDWVLSNPQFTEWLASTESHVLNILGKRGSGKSVLAAFLFQSGMREVLNHNSFYFAFTNNRNGRSAVAAWAALIHQILFEDRALFSQVFTQLGGSRRVSPSLDASLWVESRLKQIFERLLLEFKYPSVYIIDALDQCDETVEKFVGSFAALSKANAHAKVKLLVLSRQGPASLSLSARFPKLMCFDLDDQIQHDRGIKKTIKQKVDELCKKRECPQLADMITKKLSETASGMYLLPIMAINSLMKVHATPKNIMEELHRFPKDLMVAYRQSLDTVKTNHRHLVASVLLWVVFAIRPLSIKQLSSAVALDNTVETAQDLQMNTSVDLLGAEGVVELLGSNLKVSMSEGDSFVSLIHHSAREFLLRFDHTTDHSGSSSPPFWIVETFNCLTQPPAMPEAPWSRANLTLANRCFRYYYLTTQPTKRDLSLKPNSSDLDDQWSRLEGELSQKHSIFKYSGISFHLHSYIRPHFDVSPSLWTRSMILLRR